jgi:hypothetical protein
VVQFSGWRPAILNEVIHGFARYSQVHAGIAVRTEAKLPILLKNVFNQLRNNSLMRSYTQWVYRYSNFLGLF